MVPEEARLEGQRSRDSSSTTPEFWEDPRICGECPRDLRSGSRNLKRGSQYFRRESRDLRQGSQDLCRGCRIQEGVSQDSSGSII